MYKYPATRIDGVVDTHHGCQLTDQFRWLEDSDSPEVQDWADAQTAFTTRTIGEHFSPNAFHAELSELFDRDSIGLPYFVAGWYYRHARRAGQNQSTLCRSRTVTNSLGDLEVLIDPNGLREDDTITLTATAISPQGSFLAYGMSEAGQEMSTIRIRSLLTGNELDDKIPFCRSPQIRWLKDESGFFYTRNPEPGTVDKHDEHYYALVCFHRLGNDWRDDEVIFGKGRHKEDAYGLSLSDDRSILVISSGRDWTQNSLYLYDVVNGELTTLVEGEGAQYSVDIVRGRAYLWTNHEAEFGKVLVADVDQIGTLPITEWAEFIPERSYNLESYSFTSRYVIVAYLKDAVSYAEILDISGKLVLELPLPPCSSLNGLATDDERDEFFYSVSTFTVPGVQYRWNGNGNPTEIRRVHGLIEPSDYTVSQEWYESTDGTRVPMFLIRGREVKQTSHNPTLLYGYGGFNSSETPGFIPTFVPLLRRGFIIAIANIRGGGEFGEGWHQAGMLANKQNSFSDFIAAARWLVTNRYTSPEKLAIYGGSNGGLLVGACAMQAPDLFKAVVCSVPLLDMVRFPQFLIASRWMSEYGDPSDPEHFDWIIKWSPYHNFDPGRQYPAMLFLTADHDTRVEPLHARKMAALMQSGASTNPVLISIEKNAGHGSGTPVAKWVNAKAEMLAFLAWQLGL